MSNKTLCRWLIALSFFIHSHGMAVSYLGISAGPNTGNWKWKTSEDSINFNANGPSAGLLGGFGFVMEPNFYLGVEGFANWNSITTPAKFVYADTTAKLRSNWSWGLSAIPAHYIYQNTFLFLRVGFVQSFFTIDNMTQDIQDSTKALGAQFGFGIQTAVAKYFDFRAEYVYSLYRSATYLGSHDIFPQNNFFGVGLIFRIDGHPFRSLWVKDKNVSHWDGRKITDTGAYGQFPDKQKEAITDLVEISKSSPLAIGDTGI